MIIEEDIDAFAEELTPHFANSTEWQHRLADGALRVSDDFSIEKMAERFNEAIPRDRRANRPPAHRHDLYLLAFGAVGVIYSTILSFEGFRLSISPLI